MPVSERSETSEFSNKSSTDQYIAVGGSLEKLIAIGIQSQEIISSSTFWIRAYTDAFHDQITPVLYKISDLCILYMHIVTFMQLFPVKH